MLTPLQKAMSLSYTHSELLKQNLAVVIHELNVQGKQTRNLVKRLEKLRQANYEAFKEVNIELKKRNQEQEMKDDIDDILSETWLADKVTT